MSAETVRNQASQQYFELRNELNRANKTKNQKTELEFVLCQDEEEYYIIIKSTGAKHGLRIAGRFKHEVFWHLFENEQFMDFYKYMFLKICRLIPGDDNNLNEILASWLLSLWMS